MTTAQRLTSRPYAVTVDQVRTYGGRWDADYACYVFPDRSTGRFTDIRETTGSAERTLTGEPLLRWIADDGLLDTDESDLA